MAPTITAAPAASAVLALAVTAASPAQDERASPAVGAPHDRLSEDAADDSGSELEQEEDCSGGEDASEEEEEEDEQGQLLQPELAAGEGRPTMEPMVLASSEDGPVVAAGEEGELVAEGQFLLLASGGLGAVGDEGEDDVEFS